MREVTLYNLTSRKVLVGSDYLEVYKYSQPDQLTRVVNSDEMVVDHTFESVRLPVRMYKHSSWKEPLYICWDQDVQNLLDIELETTETVRNLEEKNKEYKWIIDGHKNLTIMDHLKIIYNKISKKIK